MADFDQFERLFRTCLISSDSRSSVRAASEAILALPPAKRVQIVKDREREELEGFLERARRALRSHFNHGATFDSSDDNLLGKDLWCVETGREVELKSGPSMTDANNGLSLIAWVLDDERGELLEIMRDKMLERREILLSDFEVASRIKASKVETMNLLGSYMVERVASGELPRARLEHYVRCVSRGVTKGIEIRAGFDREKLKTPPLLLSADWKNGLVVYDKSFLDDERIGVEHVGAIKTRAEICLKGQVSGRTALIYPNFKNSWTSPGGTVKFEAENWVKTPCFHVWIS